MICGSIFFCFQNDDFTSGERPESPVRVGEKLSREGSPEPEQPSSPPLIRAETPEKGEAYTFYHDVVKSHYDSHWKRF